MMSDGRSNEVLLAFEDGVATLTLNAPERRNALTEDMARAVVVACENIDARSDVGAVIVRGEGPVFCAGAHRGLLDDVGRDPASEASYTALSTVYRAFTRVGALSVPTIAAVRGGAVGAGLNLALSTDLRIVASDATMVSGFLPIGAHPGGGHFALLSRSAGRESAAAMGLFGVRLDGAKAQQIGLAWQALTDSEVDGRARELALVAAADPALARETVRTLRLELGPPALSWEAALQAEQAVQMWSFRRRLAAAKDQ